MNTTPAPRKRSTYLLAALATLGLIGWTMLTHGKQADVPAETPAALRHEGEHLIVPAASPLRRTLAIATVTEDTVSAPFVLPAAVEANPAKLVKVLPPLGGRIVSIDKQLGERVKAGDVLFTIDSADLAQARSDARKAQAALALARRNLDRQRELDKSGIAATHDLEQAQNDYEQAASDVARAEARLAQLGTRGNQGHLLAVRAPISGHVVDLNAAVGGYWNDATAPLMTVADLSQVFVTANAQEKDLGQLYVGQAASIKLDAYAEPLSAKVRYISEMLDPDTRTVKVRMLFANQDGRLKPGMFAQATFLARPHPGILVPIRAVVQSGFDSRTFVETAPWQFEPRTVKLGAQVGDKVEIAAGLKVGERVVVKDGILLND
jgi:cobalt-zinc-cadmium efflux system membrane fusion protein